MSTRETRSGTSVVFVVFVCVFVFCVWLCVYMCVCETFEYRMDSVNIRQTEALYKLHNGPLRRSERFEAEVFQFAGKDAVV